MDKSLRIALTGEGIDPDRWYEAMNADGEFADYLLARETLASMRWASCGADTKALRTARDRWPLRESVSA